MNDKKVMTRFKKITAVLTSVLIILSVSGTVFAHGVIYEQKMIGENTLRITLKWSTPAEQKGIVIKSYGIRDGKYIDITYGVEAGKPNTYTKDFDLRSLLPKPSIKLYNIQNLDASAFPDINGNYSEDYIHHLHDAGIVGGRSDGTFGPDTSVTRAEFAKMMVLALNLQGTAENTKGYTDINNHWSKNYMLLASKQGLISGYNQNNKWTLKPDSPISVAEVSTILSRAFTFKTAKNGVYSKLKQNQWYSVHVKKMFDSGILITSDPIYASFDEGIFINRANCAMMISRAITTY